MNSDKYPLSIYRLFCHQFTFSYPLDRKAKSLLPVSCLWINNKPQSSSMPCWAQQLPSQSHVKMVQWES